MLIDRSIYHYVRLELEAMTAHGFQTGHGDNTHDVLLVRDANGLPTIPATSLCGVLRHLYEQATGEKKGLFGYAEDASEDKEDKGAISPLKFSWGLVHDSENIAKEGIRDDILRDEVLSFLAESKPLVRQHVRISHTGAIEHRGKFDTTLIPKGTRYSTFISFASNGSDEDEQAFAVLLKLLNSPAFRLGHGTRSGTGAFRVVSLKKARWDLENKNDWQAFADRPRLRSDSDWEDWPEEFTTEASAYDRNHLQISLPIKAEGGWRIGGGDASFSKQNGEDKSPDLLPVSEAVIEWSSDNSQNNAGKESASIAYRKPLLPASAIKGALSHRLAFHYRRLSNQFIDEQIGQEKNTPYAHEPHVECDGVKELFGSASDHSDEADQGKVGHLVMDDLYLDPETLRTARLMHNKIDHFTGGVINGALFEEEVFWKTEFNLKITLINADRINVLTRQALEATLKDLNNGWLPLGAGGSRGLGVFLGINGKDLNWPDNGDWVSGRSEQEVSNHES